MKKKKEVLPRVDVARRLKITKGHLEKVITMVEDGVYCIDILQQTAAVRSAIKKAEEILLMNHLNSCVVGALKNGANEKTADELGRIFKKLN
jgi:DNA-binding FrmR family transcriptional regulator